jgi:hypothetical protein
MTSIFIVVYENLFDRSNMDDFVSSPVASFFKEPDALKYAQDKATGYGLIKSDSHDNTWYDPEEGAKIVYVTEIRPI